MSNTKKPVALAIGATLAGGLMLSGSAFASTQLAQGYLLGAAQDTPTAEKAKEGSCGGDKTKKEGSCGGEKKAEGKCGEGKCGEGKCGIAKADTDKDGKVSRAEFTTAHPGKDAKFDSIDTNKDGFVDEAEAKAHHEGKCGADKKAGEKGAEGKCGEGRCGGSV